MIRYFREIWLGALPLARVLWFDMLAVGTLVNFAVILALILLVGLKAPVAVALAVFVLHVPYSILLFAGVWRSSEREKTDWAWIARTIAGAWLFAALVF